MTTSQQVLWKPLWSWFFHFHNVFSFKFWTLRLLSFVQVHNFSMWDIVQANIRIHLCFHIFCFFSHFIVTVF